MMAEGGGAPTGPMVMRKDEKSPLVPLDIYPPGIDLSGHIVIWPDGSTDEWSKDLAEKYEASKETEKDGPQPEDSGGDGPDCQFFRVFLVPDFWYDYSQYTFSYGEEFMPMYLGVDPQLVASVKLLVDGRFFRTPPTICNSGILVRPKIRTFNGRTGCDFKATA